MAGIMASCTMMAGQVETKEDASHALKEYEPDDQQLYIYERNYQEQKMFVVLNFSDQEASFTMPEEWKKEEAKPLIGNYPEKPFESRTFAPWEAAVYIR